MKTATEILRDEHQANLVDACESVERNKIGAGMHERLHGLMDKLHDEIFKK